MSKETTTLDRLRPSADWAKSPLLNRKGWKAVRFGDVVDNLNETCDPEHAGLDRFIGLEHLEPGSLHVRQYGRIADGITFNRRCRPGQVLFGKRRAYQRKVAVADVNAVVSGDIYVLAPKSNRLLPELLPFICLSDRFLQHAIETSAGSLSPRTNWSSLSSFEFDLPPPEQQQRIAALLWAADQAMESVRSLSDKVAGLRNAQVTTAMREYVLPHEHKPDRRPLGELFDERRENGFGDLPILAVTIAGKVVPRESLERSVIDKTGTDKYLRVRAGDIAYNTMRMWQGSCGVVREDGIISPAYTVLVPHADRADPAFWNYAFHTPEMLDWFRRFSTGVASDRWRLYYRDFARIPARCPPLKVQQECVRRFTLSEHVLSDTQAHYSQLWDVLQAGVNTVVKYPQGA